MKIEIFDIDGTLTYVHGDIPDTTELKTYAYWPLITEKFTKSVDTLKKMIEAWEESMKTEQDPTGSSHRMLQAGLETFHVGVTADKVRQFAKETTLLFIKHGVIRKEAISYLENKVQQGVICILSTGSYQDGAFGFVDALVETGLLSKQSQGALRISGAIVDWEKMNLTHANVRERKLLGIEIVMQQKIHDLKPHIEAAYADDPWINDRDIITISPQERAYVISTIKNKDKILPAGCTLITWALIIEQSKKDKSITIEKPIPTLPPRDNEAKQSEMTHYALKVGEEGAPRLRLLNEMCNPLSLEFIENNIALKNKRILEIGCGIGIMSSELALRSLPDGTVLATDISNEQLQIAERVAKSSGIKNISFLQIQAENIDQISGKFDLIYCRFVLAHLKGSMAVIQKVTSLMHENSLLICEEPEDIQSMYCDPPEPIYEKWKQAVFKQVDVYKSDFSIGKSLSSMFQENKLTSTKLSTVQPVMETSHLKQQLWQGVVEISGMLIQHGFASESEVNEMINKLKIFADTSKSKVGFFKYTQIAAKKDLVTSDAAIKNTI